jgi:hypothetical protein
MPDLTTGFDRADGIAGRLGTATPAGAVEVDVSGQTGTVAEFMPIEELTDSPTIERAEQATLTHKFRMSYDEAMNRIQWLGRGLVREDSFGNVFKLLSASIQHEKAGTAVLTTVDESISFDSPPDQFSVVPVELGISIIKHPRYFYAFLGDGYGSATEQKNQMVIRMLQNYFDNVSAAYRDSLTKKLKESLGTDGAEDADEPGYNSEDGSFNATLITGTDMAKRAAMEIIQKYWRGEETPYIVGYQIIWASFYFRPPYLNPGGYIENPMSDASPQLPDYFSSPNYPPDSATIFDFIAAINPQSYSSNGLSNGAVNISWLRKADDIDYERTWFKISRTWIGSPVGFWDTELYSSGARPQSADDYLVINSP